MSQTRCPICDAGLPGNWQDYPDYPFCTRRCRLVDLGRWLGEDYRVANKPDSDPDDSASTPGEEGDGDAR